MYIEEIIKDRDNYKPPTLEQALEWFPDESPTSELPVPDLRNRKHLKFLIKQEEIKLEKILKKEGEVRNIRDRDLKYQENLKWVSENVYVTIPREEAIANIKRYKGKLAMLAPVKANASAKGVTPQQVAKAKEFPIDQLIDFTQHVACCIFHTEDTPSMHYYSKDNHVHCFGCNKGGDAIDVYMELNNTNFLDSVRILCQ